MKNKLNRALAAQKKQYLMPQTEVNSLYAPMALCSGSANTPVEVLGTPIENTKIE